VFEAETTEHVAEWRHNKTDVPTQIKILADVIKEIHSVVKDEKKIYYSVENNTLGEGALVAISEYGEERIPGFFLSEPGKSRKGFNTTAKSKLAACTKLKYYLESSKLKLHSKNLIGEIKTFVAHGPSFAAKEGETDDLVMATILCVRVVEHLMRYDEATWNYLVERHSDDFITPMPIGVL
jgi:hypothetical protein